MILLKPTILPRVEILIQSQLVILRLMRNNPNRNFATLLKIQINLKSNEGPWKFSSALTKIKSIMLRACAITAIISMVETAMQMLALILTGLFMQRGNAKIATLMIITNKSVE